MLRSRCEGRGCCLLLLRDVDEPNKFALNCLALPQQPLHCIAPHLPSPPQRVRVALSSMPSSLPIFAVRCRRLCRIIRTQAPPPFPLPSSYKHNNPPPCQHLLSLIFICLVLFVLFYTLSFRDLRTCLRTQAGTPPVTRHTSHVTRHTSHVTRHTSHVTRHTSHVTRHTSHVTRHTSHVTRHTSHVTRHMSHATRHTPHLSPAYTALGSSLYRRSAQSSGANLNCEW